MASNVSVIIPAYNVAPVLRRVIESAINQTISPKEIIVIDDGSEDETATVAQSFGDRIIFLQQPNQGQGAARNNGLNNATGEYIAFLDADDYWKPRFIEKTSQLLDANPEAAAVSCGFLVKRPRGDYIGPRNIEELKSQYPRGLMLDDFFEFWAKYDHIRTGTVLIRRSVIDMAGFQNENLRISQDLEYWGLLGTYGPWALVPEVLWIGDSHSHATKQGWRKRYKTRQRLCPTVEAWQERILPRLTENQTLAFKTVRGRVASGYALNTLLAGNREKALAIVQQYSHEMPDNKMVRLMRAGAVLGALGWMLVSFVIRLREYTKG